MRNHTILIGILASMLMLAAAAPLSSQGGEFPIIQSRNLSGPRLGVTTLRTTEWLGETSTGPQFHVISQFGWHFEYQVVPEGGGPQFVVQWVPMIGGVELGTIVPSFTLALGIRLPSGFELGMGPNVTYANELITALIVGIGKSFEYGGVSIPLNLAYAISADRSNRFSFLMGYALRRK